MEALSQIGEYDTKRLLATKALQTKPVAHEPRTPSNTWSGLGFSSSMPESMIREQLKDDTKENSSSSPPPPPLPTPQANNVAPTIQPSPRTPNGVVHEPSVGAGPTTGNWFGNSSALDSLLLNSKTLAKDNAHFDDDLPSLFAKQVR